MSEIKTSTKLAHKIFDALYDEDDLLELKQKKVIAQEIGYELSVKAIIDVELACVNDMEEEVDRLRRERDEFLEILCGIQNACIGQIAMGHALEPEIIGFDITEATKMTNPELNAYIAKIKGNDNA